MAVFIIACPLFAFSAKVIKISDGDTITVLSGKEQTKVRLYGIDAPEKKQDYGQRSKQFLASLIAGQVVEVDPRGKDRYKRTIGTIYLDGKDINAQMVANGYAWGVSQVFQRNIPRKRAKAKKARFRALAR